jgi:hypothetical protein
MGNTFQLENRPMYYPNILLLIAYRHAVPLERARKLWDEAAAHSNLAIGLTPEDAPDWERVMSRFLESIRTEARTPR